MPQTTLMVDIAHRTEMEGGREEQTIEVGMKQKEREKRNQYPRAETIKMKQKF